MLAFLGALAGGAILMTVPAEWLLYSVIAILCIGATTLPVVASIGGIDLQVGDIALILVAATCLVRGPAMPRHSEIIVWAILLLTWGILRTMWVPFSISSYLRLFLPVLVMPLLVRVAPPGWRPWTALRIVAIVIVLEAAVESLPALPARWGSIAGGPAETGLVSAVLVTLSAAMPKGDRSRLIGLMIGSIGILGTRSIMSAIAVAFALAYLAIARSGAGTRRGLSVLAIGALVVTVFSATLALRQPSGAGVPAAQTLEFHSRLAGQVSDAFAKVDPIIGGGWGASRSLTTTEGPTGQSLALHNVYLDWLVDLGITGLALLFVWLWVLFRAAELDGRIVVVTTAIWSNVANASPTIGWSMFAFVTLACMVPVAAEAIGLPPSASMRNTGRKTAAPT